MMGKTTKAKTSLSKYAYGGAEGSEAETDTPGASSAPTGGDPAQPAKQYSLNDVMLTIQKGNKAIEDKLDDMASKLSSLQGKLHEVTERVTTTESTLTGLVSWKTDISNTVDDLKDRIRRQSAQADDLEGRMRRNNVRLVGLPESTESGGMVDFLTGLLSKVFDAPPFREGTVIDRAHRTPSRRPRPGAPPRPILMHFVSYLDRDRLLEAARLQGKIKYGSNTISFYPDFTQRVRESRMKFNKVKQELRKRSWKYALLFPATLRVIADGKTFFFDTPAGATAFIESRGSDPAPANDQALDEQD